MAVSTAPVITPKTGLLKYVRIFVNSGMSAKGLTAPLIADMPYISTAKPIMMDPISLFFPFFEAIIRTMPMIARIGEKALGLSILTTKLSPCSPVKLRIQAVMVVPILAPMMMPIP